MLLGGQHCSAAVWRIYHHQRDVLHIPEEEIDNVWKVVKAQVMKKGAPRALRKLASGYHQRIQHATTKVGSAAVLTNLLRTVKHKVENNLDPTFTDDELYKEVLASGIETKGKGQAMEEDPPEEEGKGKGKKRRRSASELEVFLFFLCGFSPPLFPLSTKPW